MSGRIFLVKKICTCGAVLENFSEEWNNSSSMVAAAKEEMAFLKNRGFRLPETEKCPSCKGMPERMCGYSGFSYLDRVGA